MERLFLTILEGKRYGKLKFAVAFVTPYDMKTHGRIIDQIHKRIHLKSSTHSYYIKEYNNEFWAR